MLSARFASVLRRMLLSIARACGRGFAVNPSYAPRSKIGYRARRSVGISSAQAPRFAVRNHQSQGGERDQGERILSQHRGLQVRHGILSHPAHADGSAEAWPRLQTHGGRRRHRRRCAWGARDICRYGSSLFQSTDAFQTAFAPHAQSILADIPNYTNTQPTIQVSEVRL